jgi:hypothetical protein
LSPRASSPQSPSPPKNRGRRLRRRNPKDKKPAIQIG